MRQRPPRRRPGRRRGERCRRGDGGRWLGLKPHDVEITGGTTTRSKVVTIDGDPVQLMRRLQALTAVKAEA